MSTADDRYAEEERTRTGVGLVLGLWLSGVFAASLGGWFEHGRDNQPAMALLCAAIVWPLGYFLVSRHRFMPQSFPFGATAALATFFLISALSSFMSPAILRSTGYVVLTVAGLWVALQFNSALDREDYERGLRTFVLLTGVLLVGFAWFDYVPGKRLGTGKDVLNPNTIALVSTSVLLAAMAFRTLVLRLAAMAPIAGIIVLTSSRAATAATVAGLATIEAGAAAGRHRADLCGAARGGVRRGALQGTGSVLCAEHGRSRPRLRSHGTDSGLESRLGPLRPQSGPGRRIPRS
jgi:MFS family permease